MNETTVYNIRNQLDRLADLRSQVDVINLRFDELRDEILTPEIRAQLEAVEAERKTALDAASDGISTLESEIKNVVIEMGDSIKGNLLMAVYNKGRASWDTKALEGLALAFPDVLKARKLGDPYVTLRAVK